MLVRMKESHVQYKLWNTSQRSNRWKLNFDHNIGLKDDEHLNTFNGQHNYL